jgi:hypothetical protein
VLLAIAAACVHCKKLEIEKNEPVRSQAIQNIIVTNPGQFGWQSVDTGTQQQHYKTYELFVRKNIHRAPCSLVRSRL